MCHTRVIYMCHTRVTGGFSLTHRGGVIYMCHTRVTGGFSLTHHGVIYMCHTRVIYMCHTRVTGGFSLTHHGVIYMCHTRVIHMSSTCVIHVSQGDSQLFPMVEHPRCQHAQGHDQQQLTQEQCQAQCRAACHSLLGFSFPAVGVSEVRTLAGSSLSQVTVPGLQHDQSSLLMAGLPGGWLLQVGAAGPLALLACLSMDWLSLTSAPSHISSTV
jgi:hypothetical protein